MDYTLQEDASVKIEGETSANFGLRRHELRTNPGVEPSTRTAKKINNVF